MFTVSSFYRYLLLYFYLFYKKVQLSAVIHNLGDKLNGEKDVKKGKSFKMVRKEPYLRGVIKGHVFRW